MSVFGHRYLAVAGFLSTPKLWDQAELQWRQTLKTYGANNFHTTDFRSGRAAPYKDWTERKRATFEQWLMRLIRKRTQAAVAIVASVTDYDALDGATKERLGNPYGLCAMRAIWEVSKLIEREGGDAHVAYIFETGGKDEGPWIAAMQGMGVASAKFKSEMRIHSVTPMTKAQVRVFDMADLLAWEATHHAPKRFERSMEPMSEALKEIQGCKYFASAVFDDELFREIAHRNTPEYLALMHEEYGLTKRKGRE